MRGKVMRKWVLSGRAVGTKWEGEFLKRNSLTKHSTQSALL